MKKQHYFPILIVIYIIVLNATYASCQIIDSLKHRITTEINDSVKVELLNYIARDYKDYYPDSLNIALSYAKQALQLAKKTNNPKGQYDALNYIGNFYLDLNNRKQCVKAYERGMTIADSIGNKRKKLQLKGNLATAYTQWNEFEKAIKMKYEKIEAKFETVKKEEAIKSLETQKEIDAIKLKNTNRILWITSAVLFTLLGLLFFIFKLYNQGKIKNDIISSTLSDKELLLKEIHHRVKNNLQVVSSLLSLQSEYIKDDAALSAINEGRSRVRSMALIHQNLYSEGNLTGINVKSYLEKLISGLFETYNISEDEITLDIDIENVELDVDIVIPLGLIANELVSNALKHAFVDQKDGNIKVSLITAKNSLTFEVQDNGIGVDTTLDIEEMESFGYQMIFAFKEKLEAELKIENESGTKVSLHIDNFQKLNNDS